MNEMWESVNSTKKLLIIDPAWKTFGVSAEIAAQAAENCPGVTIRRIGYPSCYTPMAKENEAAFYPDADSIRMVIEEVLVE